MFPGLKPEHVVWNYEPKTGGHIVVTLPDGARATGTWDDSEGNGTGLITLSTIFMYESMPDWDRSLTDQEVDYLNRFTKNVAFDRNLSTLKESDRVNLYSKS